MDSALSGKVTATSPPQPAPMPPILGTPVFDKLIATLPITLPATHVNGDPIGPIASIKVYWGPAGSDLANEPKVFSGPFDPGTDKYSLQIEVPAWNTAYDFAAEVSI